MPIINTYFYETELGSELQKHISNLKIFAAKELSCSDIQLKPNEITVRHLRSEGGGMIAEVEIEIFVHSFKDRVKRQDEICLNIRRFLMEKLQNKHDVRVWLVISELGHSWE